MDLSKLMKQAQMMQKKIGALETELNETIYSGNSGGETGVTVTLNGKYEVQSISFGDDLMEKDNKEMLQDMLMIAFNAAAENARTDRETKMNSVTSGVKIPGM